MTAERANEIYNILVEFGGAPESERDPFVYSYMMGDLDEWRFCGKLGFGGKYWNKRNAVSCYPEDETPQRIELINKINEILTLQSLFIN
jgi:hypothetical protein